MKQLFNYHMNIYKKWFAGFKIMNLVDNGVEKVGDYWFRMSTNT